MKKVWIFALVLGVILSLAACGNNSKAIAGKWYNDRGRALDVQSGGTWTLEDLYGSGTWKYLDDKKTIDFTDFYGEIYETEVFQDELGEYLKLNYYGKFYRNAYPQQQESAPSTVESKVEETGLNPTGESRPTEEPVEVITIDPFEGIEYEVSGISPYCEIAVNNQNTSEEAQKYVTYTLDKEKYANGETAIITASISTKGYSLSKTQSSFEIVNQPEYISSVDEVDLSTIESELEDYLISRISSAKGDSEIFDVSDYNLIPNPEEISSWINREGFGEIEYTMGDIYLSVLKSIKLDVFGNYDYRIKNGVPYNILSYVVRLEIPQLIMGGGLEEGKVFSGILYVNISALNIVRYQDGTIKWGTNGVDDYNFIFATSNISKEDCVTTSIMNSRDIYNISKVNVQE